VQSGTEASAPLPYTRTMQIEYTQGKLAALWILLVGVIGYATAMTSPAGLTILGVVGVAPPLILWHFWRKPTPTISESIHDVLQ